MVRSRHYGQDVLARQNRRPRPGQGPVPQVGAEPGLVVEDFEGRFCGAVVAYEKDSVTLEDRHGKRRAFPLPGTFLLEGKRVTLVRPGPTAPAAAGPRKTASGSIAAPDQRAKVARASRIYVEGRHDAELVAQVWGADLKIEGVVVEHLGGVDDLVGIVADFRPGPGRRLGVLVDHLVAGSKETRIADAVRKGPGGADTLVVGHPYVDIWQAVKPARLGLAAWPSVPRNIEWKHGACQALGLPHANQADIAGAWRHIRSRVRDWNDLEPALIGRVEELIDFVTQPGT